MPGIALGAVALLTTTARAQAGYWGGSIGATSDNVFRGVSQSDGSPAAQADLHYSFGPWYTGLSVANVRRSRDISATVESIAYGGYVRRVGADWTLGLMLRHYDYPWNTPHQRYDYDEAAASLSWRDRVSVQLIASPDTYAAGTYRGIRYGNNGTAFCYEIVAHQPLPHNLSANIGGGYYDLRRELGSSYVYWSVALSRSWRAWHLDLGYIGTDERARAPYGDAAGNRLVLTALWLF